MKKGTSCGSLSGHIQGTESRIGIKTVSLDLDRATAFALCNLLHDQSLKDSTSLERDQAEALSSLGAALGRIVGHPSQNNMGLTEAKN